MDQDERLTTPSDTVGDLNSFVVDVGHVAILSARVLMDRSTSPGEQLLLDQDQAWCVGQFLRRKITVPD